MIFFVISHSNSASNAYSLASALLVWRQAGESHKLYTQACPGESLP